MPVLPSNSSSGSGAGTSLTVAHTVLSGSDRLLRVSVTLYSDSTQTVSSVTYGGVSLALVPDSAAEVGDARVEQWYLVNPAVGTDDVVITPTATTPAIAATAVSYTGVNQAVPLGTCAAATGTSTTPTVNVTSVEGELVVDALAFWGGGGSASPVQGGGQTFREDDFYQHAFGRFYSATSEEDGAGSVTMSWSIDSSYNWAISAVPIKPAAGGGGGGSPSPVVIGKQLRGLIYS